MDEKKDVKHMRDADLARHREEAEKLREQCMGVVSSTEDLKLERNTYRDERDAARQQVSRLTEALRGIYATKVRRSGGSFGFNIKFNGIYSRELSDLIYLTPPAARQGEKEKP